MHLAEKYMPLAKSIAYRVAPEYHDKEELESVALLALVEVVNENNHDEAQVVEHIRLRVRGAVINYLNRDMSHLGHELAMPDDDSLDYLNAYDPHKEQDEMPQKVRDAIKKLEPIDQRLVKMHYYENMTHQEIADQLGVERSTITKKLQRVTGALRDIL